MKMFYLVSIALFLLLGAAICFGQPTPAPTATLVLTWTDNSSDETQFIVQRSLTGKEEDFGDIGSAPKDATIYTDTMAPAGVKLWYRVRAVNALEQGTASAVAIYTPPVVPTPTPAAPVIPKKATNLKVKQP